MPWRFLLVIVLLNFTIAKSDLPEYLLNEGKPFETKQHICVDNCCKSKYDFTEQESLQGNFPKQIYDVLNYNLWVDLSYFLDKADKEIDNSGTLYFSGKQIVTLRIDSAGHNYFYLDANDLIIDKVKIRHKNVYTVNYKYEKINKLEFFSNSNFEIGDTIIIEIDYEVRRNKSLGIYYFGRGAGEIPEGSEPLIYTQSEPAMAKFWMPCNDRPYDKAITSVSITVPVGFTGISNGNLDSVRAGKSGAIQTETFYYSHSSPLSSYLTTVVASKYSYFEQYYPRYSNNLDTVPIGNYMWEMDLNPPEGHVFNGKNALRNQPEMLRLYSSQFGEYSFDRYGTVAVAPYMFGGMEHQTMTTIHRNWLRYDADIGLAHEIAHHWIGNLITCATWNDIWINEGGATWFEALWIENVFKDSKYYYQHMVSKSNYYLSKNDAHLHSVFGVPENRVFELTYITYDKAGWVFHMLSELVGRDKFFKVMENIFENNKFLAVSTADFIDLFKTNIDESKMDLDLFFEQWVYDSGHPIYQITATYPESEVGKFAYDVYVSQVQEGEGYRDVYEMPIDLVFIDETGKILTSEPVYNNRRNQMFSFEFDFPVHAILVDYRKVLCKIDEMAVSVVNNPSRESGIITAPNPVEPGSQINLFYDSNVQIFEVKIYDMLGNLILNKTENHSINMITAPLAPGMYILELNTNTGIQRKKVMVN